MDELRARQSLALARPSMHSRGVSSVSLSSSSVRSFGMGALRENVKECEGEDYFGLKKAERLSRDSGIESSTSNSMRSPRGNVLPDVVMSPSSVSFGLAQRNKLRPKKAASNNARGRPSGDWI